jgi:hypothetical protein
LLKEAQKLGADNIVNVKIEGNFVDRTAAKLYGLYGMFSKAFPLKKTWYGSATAIKYTDTIKRTETQVVVIGTGTDEENKKETKEPLRTAAKSSDIIVAPAKEKTISVGGGLLGGLDRKSVV